MDSELTYIISQLDFGTVIRITWPLLLMMSNKAITKYKLYKNFKIKDITKIKTPPVLKQKYNEINLENISNTKFKDQVLEFTNIITEKFSEADLINFYNNINELTIKKNVIILLLASSGLYSPFSNTIRVSEKSSIYHELFHAISTIHDSQNKMNYVGFSQLSYDINSKFVNIGTGINEGYTEFLTKRYFGENHIIPKSYVHEVNIVEKLEKIIGKEKMQSLYLNANLPGLIDEMKKYSSEEDVSKFISRVDLINKHSLDTYIFQNEKIKESVINIYEFLLKSYIFKLKRELEQGIIDINKFIEKTAEYTKSLGTNIRIMGHHYKFLTVDSLIENYKSVIDIHVLSEKNNDINNLYKRKILNQL